jgi:aspartyl-tRNA(Asn)/glutamyl-tRNA(Gln) amidotransferase subunit A
VRRLVQQDFDKVFATPNRLITDGIELNEEGVDVLLCPTAPTLAPLLEEIENQDSIHAYMNDVFTVPASLAGLPAISVPIHSQEENGGLMTQSAGMQIIGQYGDDKLVLAVARELIHAADVR